MGVFLYKIQKLYNSCIITDGVEYFQKMRNPVMFIIHIFATSIRNNNILTDVTNMINAGINMSDKYHSGNNL